MKPRSISFIALFAITLCMFSVSGIRPAIAAEDAPQDPAYSDPAKAIEAEVLKDFSVVLESNPTTGFGWDISRPLDEKMVKFVSSEYVAAETGLVGSGGREIWTFRAISPGKATISFRYVRPWEKNVPPIKETAFTVIIRQEK